jgi:hypothetical protein
MEKFAQLETSFFKLSSNVPPEFTQIQKVLLSTAHELQESWSNEPGTFAPFVCEARGCSLEEGTNQGSDSII